MICSCLNKLLIISSSLIFHIYHMGGGIYGQTCIVGGSGSLGNRGCEGMKSTETSDTVSGILN